MDAFHASLPQLLSGSNSQDDGKLISPVICPLPTKVDRTWGSSSTWVLELRDGRRVSIPHSLLRQPVVTALLPTDSVAAGQLVTREELVGVGSTVDDLISLGGSLGGSEYSGVEDESKDDVLLVWEDPEVDGLVVSWYVREMKLKLWMWSLWLFRNQWRMSCKKWSLILRNQEWWSVFLGLRIALLR